MIADRLLAKALCFAVLAPGILAAEETDPNRLTSAEEQLGFELLFNGRDFQGWKNPGGWVIDDGSFAFRERGGGLVYREKKVPDDFELRFQWKVAEGSNSGVTCRPGLYEYQILDNEKNGDGKNPRTSAAALYFCMAPSHDATKPIGQWNTSRIVYKETILQHWLNGEKVVGFDYKDPKWAANVELLRAPRRHRPGRPRGVLDASEPRTSDLVPRHQTSHAR